MELNEQKIREILVQEKYLVEADLEAYDKLDPTQRPLFIDFVIGEGLISEDLYGQAMADHFHVGYVNFKKQDVDEDTIKLVPETAARAKKVIAFGRTPNHVKLAMSNPSDIETRHMIEKRVGQKARVFFAFDDQINELLQIYKSSIKEEFEKIVKRIEDKTLSKEEKDEITVKIVDLMIQYGYNNKASDIHVEPYRKRTVVRFRIDGVMHNVLDIRKDLSESIVTRIKILSRMRTDEHLTAQDGKLRFNAGVEVIDVRVSVVPVTQGENIVMRLLTSKGRRLSLAALGLSESDMNKMKKAIGKPHGMILVTGPTGSGKTSTLYTVMNILNRPEVHISTIEDPVEFDVEGISQIQVNPRAGLTFAKGLRAIVRQDPDIIMVGEIRDEETASIAVNSALTGHSVLSTLHTNDAPTAIPRFIDMGVEPFLISSTVNIVIAQRLVRMVCENCRASHPLTAEEKALFDDKPHLKEICKNRGYDDLDKVHFYKGEGCSICGHTGYVGRIGIFEILEMTDTVRQLISKKISSDIIMKAAIDQDGFTTMFEDGIDKVFQGMTTISEVMRVIEE